MPRETKTKEKKPVVPKTAAKARSVDGGEATIYNQKGEKSGTYLLPAEIFGLPWNADLVHQIMHSQQLNARANTAHTKDRGDVRGGGKKPWQQKGTGRARHGSRRSPIWVGGGVAHGPRKDKDYTRKINDKMKKKAFYTILFQKFRDNEVIFMDSLRLNEPKTKEGSGVIANISKLENFEKMRTKRKNKAILSLTERDENTQKGFRNIPGVVVAETRNLNPLEIGRA